MAKRLQGFVVGILLGLAIPATAAEVYVRCEPALRPSCSEDMLGMYFANRGQIPNRCKVS